AFISMDSGWILELCPGGLSGLPSSHESPFSCSSPLQRGSCRPIRFEPPMLDFHEQPVGMPKMEKVHLHNPSSEETIILISISATTAHFHASFFQNRVIPPGGNTSFDVVFLARVVGNVENTLFINTSHHGVFTYQVFGVGIPNPYRLRPFIGARVPVNSSFSPLINIHNPHSEPLQVVEMYSSGGDLHLELPTGQQGGTKKFWEIPPFETKGVMRASFSSRDADNHTAFIRIKTNASSEDEFIILPVEVEVTAAPGIYSSTEMLDFGTLRSQDRPKQLNLHLLNSGTKDVPITSIRPTPSNEAVSIDFKPVTLRAGENRYTKVASISFDASKARRPFQFSGKITVKAKEKSYSKLEIPYQAEVLEGYLGFDHTATLFHIRDSPTDPVERLVFLTNTFSFAILIHNVSLPEEAKTMFVIHNFSTPVLVLPHESQSIFTLYFQPVRPSIHIDSNILLITNASKFHLPIRAYTGFLEPVVLPPSPVEHTLDFSVLSATDVNSLIFVVVNSNPIELKIKSWFVTGDSLTMDLLRAESGNRTTWALSLRAVRLLSQVILASGYYAVFRVTLAAKDLEGIYDGAVHITTDYEILTIQVKAVIAVGTLTSSPKHIFLPASFPGKTVHHSLNILSSYSQRVKLQEVRSLTEDARFYSKRLRSNKDELEPQCRSKVANIYFDASLQCGDHCYVGLPFLLKSESKPHGLSMQEGAWDADVELHQTLLRRWQELKDGLGHEVRAVFEVNTDLQKKVQTMVTAQMTWPSIIGSARQIIFPLTNGNSSSEEQLVLENPADVPVYVQVLPLALYPNPSAFAEKLADRFPLGKSMNISTNTLEFQVYKNHVRTPLPQSSFFGPARVLLSPGEERSLLVRFTPMGSHSVTSLLIVRNNLTVLDYLIVQGQGTTESLKVAGRPPGPGSSLRFKMTESLLKDCTDEVKSKEPNFTLRRTFKVENVGQLPISIRSTEISGYACEGFGFKVLNCQEFALKPNASKDIVILFTPDFTASRVIRELKLVTAGGSEFLFVLNASLPYHMLAPCADALPRPSWELELYVIVSLIMSSMFLLVMATAYLEAQGIWEPFRRRLSLEAANGPMETGKPFDLRDIVRIQTDPKYVCVYNVRTCLTFYYRCSCEYGDSNHNVTRGMYATGGSLLRGGGRPCGRTSTDLEGLRSRTGSSRAAMQTGPQFGGKGSGGSGSSSDGLPTQCQLPVRRLRGSRSAQQPAPPQQVLSPPEPPAHTPAVAAQPPKPQPEGPARLSSEDSDYIGLLEAMDKDLDRPESPSVEVFPEQSLSPAAQSRGGKMQRKSKAQKKREEKEQQGRGKPRAEDLKDVLADDDSSSTTTETSNPDVEASIKEVRALHGRPLLSAPLCSSPLLSARPAGSLELPYVTPLENKQRKNFTAKLHPTLTTGVKARPLPKQRAGIVDCRPSPLGKFLSQGLPQELGNSSSSEGEKDSPPPEWDTVPLHKAGSPADSLQQLSFQTMNADPFLKRPLSDMSRTCSPPVTCRNVPYSDEVLSYSAKISVVVGESHCPLSTVLCASLTCSETGLKKAAGNRSKLAPLATLPGKNGNPTFAAVAAGYDKSPGGSGPPKAGTGKAEAPGKPPVPRLTSVESDASDSSGLWSPTDSANSPNFNPFGPNNTFNLSGGKDIKRCGSQEPQQNWGDFNSVQPSIWDAPSTEPLHPWPISSGSPTAPTASILGNPSSLWSPGTLFSSPIWSTSGDSSLHSLAPVTPAPLSDLICSPDGSCPTLAPPSTPAPEIGRAYNPWSVWGPTLSRRSSEPWPNPSDKDA
uniref:Transmembrane protein 131 n=1 Tax=Paramormyrops kingsleyae TaxID=1676925 RepID=A0A3B3REH4_9TELE